jgi:hypothetical protein
VAAGAVGERLHDRLAGLQDRVGRTDLVVELDDAWAEVVEPAGKADQQSARDELAHVAIAGRTRRPELRDDVLGRPQRAAVKRSSTASIRARLDILHPRLAPSARQPVELAHRARA